MKTQIFIFGIPSVIDLMEKMEEAVDNAFKKYNNCLDEEDFNDEEDDDFYDDDYEPCYEPPKKTCKKPESCCGEPAQPWGIAGKPADKNIRFGYGLQVDEPRSSDYRCRWQFEDDHAAYDRFVEAGEDCVARGLEKKGSEPIHKCQAIRQPVCCPPPQNIDLIGETDWWSTKKIGW